MEATLAPGTLTKDPLGTTWHGDFFLSCGGYWPVAAPESVVPQGTTDYPSWTRGLDPLPAMITSWHKLGFVVRQGDDLVEVDRCDSELSIHLLTAT